MTKVYHIYIHWTYKETFNNWYCKLVAGKNRRQCVCITNKFNYVSFIDARYGNAKSILLAMCMHLIKKGKYNSNVQVSLHFWFRSRFILCIMMSACVHVDINKYDNRQIYYMQYNTTFIPVRFHISILYQQMVPQRTRTLFPLYVIEFN